jgi:hypothetical protein
VSPEVDDVLTDGMRKLLEAEDRTDVFPSLWTRQYPRIDAVAQ